SLPTVNHVYTSALNVPAPPHTSWYSTTHDSAHAIATPRIAAPPAPMRPIRLRSRPATTAPASGASTMISRRVSLITRSFLFFSSFRRKPEPGHFVEALGPGCRRGDEMFNPSTNQF